MINFLGWGGNETHAALLLKIKNYFDYGAMNAKVDICDMIICCVFIFLARFHKTSTWVFRLDISISKFRCPWAEPDPPENIDLLLGDGIATSTRPLLHSLHANFDVNTGFVLHSSLTRGNQVPKRLPHTEAKIILNSKFQRDCQVPITYVNRYAEIR